MSEKRSVLEEMLMHNLEESAEGMGQDQAAFQISLVLAMASDTFDEVTLDLYLAPLSVNNDYMINALNWFAGAGFIKVECMGHSNDFEECLAQKIHNPGTLHYLDGEMSAQNESEDFIHIVNSVKDFRTYMAL